MGKEKIQIRFVDKDGNVEEIEREVDVAGWKDLEEMEKVMEDIEAEGYHFLIGEGLKKKKGYWLRKLWWKILDWSGMGKRVSRLRLRKRRQHMKDSNSNGKRQEEK
jgi:hypothetical protein